jgi:hypothetical protein
MPNNSLGTLASAGYTFEFFPSAFDLKSSYDSVTNDVTISAGGR